MQSFHTSTQKTIKSHRKQILIVVSIYSLLITLSNLVTQKLNISWIGLIISAVLTMIYLIHIYQYVNCMVSNNTKTQNWKSFFTLPQLKSKRSFLIIAVTYITWILLSFFVLALSIPYPPLGIFAIIIIVGMFVYINGVNYEVANNQKNNHNIRAYLTVLKVTITNYRFILLGVFQIIKTVIQGSIIIFMINVFIYGPQIQEILNLPETKTHALITDLFTNNISSFIQTVGAQALMYYLFFVILTMFGVINYKKMYKN